MINRREEYVLHDMSSQRLIDAHLNGGTYNVGTAPAPGPVPAYPHAGNLAPE